jgi:hypothetical protein
MQLNPSGPGQDTPAALPKVATSSAKKKGQCKDSAIWVALMSSDCSQAFLW